jgi:hypothetical protein
MKRVVKVVLILMTILTVIYASAVVYANANSNSESSPYPHRYVLYAAVRYEGDIPPPEWYMPEQLGIYNIIEYVENASWLHIEVDREKEPFPLQEKQPVFLYKDKFYQVSPLWATPALTESANLWQVPIGLALGTGWVFTCALFVKMRKEK